MSDITRTFTDTTITAKVFDNTSDEITTICRVFHERIELEDSKKKLSKVLAPEDFTILKVLAVDYDSKRKGMTEDDFMTFGEKVDARSKDTRGMVSKEIIGQQAICVTVNNDDFSVAQRSILLPRKMDGEEAKRFINKRVVGYTVVKVLTIEEVKELWVMPPETFLAHAFDVAPYADKDSDE